MDFNGINKKPLSFKSAMYNLQQEESIIMTSIPEELNPLVEAIRKLKVHGEIGTFIRQEGLKLRGFVEGSIFKGSRPGNTYYYKDFEISHDLISFSRNYNRDLSFLNELNIQCAPQLVCNIEIENKSVTITCLPGAEDEKLIPYKQASALVDIKAKKQFLSDMEKLADNGYVHDYAARGTAHWFVTPDFKRIYLNAWDVLRAIEGNEKQVVIDEIKRLLKLG